MSARISADAPVERAVRQVLQRVPAERPAHARDHEADDRRGDRIEKAHAGEAADDADRDDQRRRGVRARMPRVRDEHRGAHALRLAQHVAKQPSFDSSTTTATASALACTGGMSSRCTSRSPARHSIPTPTAIRIAPRKNEATVS